MAEPAEAGPGGVGPVEHEARQLVEAAARWLSAVPDSGEYAGRTVDREADAEASAGLVDEPRDARGSEESAGSETSGEHLCRGCPWCRAKAAAGPIGADTLESLAHLLGSAAESLALFAQSRREAQHHTESQHQTEGRGETESQHPTESRSETDRQGETDSQGETEPGKD